MIEVLIIFTLILLNGVLSMSEAALLSVRKSKLEVDAKHGDKRASALLKLLVNPDRFLSMIQIGITLIGILNGLFSGHALDHRFALLLEKMGLSASVASVVSPVVIVAVVTYLTIVIGELVPKMVGINKSETVAKLMCKPIAFMSKVVAPIVWLLSVGTNGIVKLLGIKNETDRVTEEEIRAMVNEGYEGGQVTEMEREIVTNAFDLDNVNVASVMTHRSDYDWIDIRDRLEDTLGKVRSTLRSVYPVCDKSSENILGVIYLKDFPLLSPHPEQFDIGKKIHKCNFVPESMSLYKALESFKHSGDEYAIVIDEYGAVQGIVTLHDIIEVLVGGINEVSEEPDIVKRDDGSWLVEGQMSFYEFADEFDLDVPVDDLPFQTIGGLVLDILEHIPHEGEKVEWNNFQIEVIDMDGARIDKLLVKRKPNQPSAGNDTNDK